MNKFLLDTSYIIALELQDDQYHKEALNHWQTLGKSSPHLVTTSYIFDEVVTFFNSRRLHYKALEIGSILLSDSTVEIIQVNDKLFYQAWEYFKKHKDKSYCLTDCISFLVMEELGISTALTFDEYFQQAGFERLPLI